MSRPVFIAENKYADELKATAKTIATRGKGILAADESTGTIGKRLASINVENNRENRRAYRHLLFTSKGWNEFCSGVILYDETLRDTSPDGKKKLIDIVKEAGVIPGIKVDMGTRPLFGTNNELYTQGLTDLDKRTAEYYSLGARFAKWRAVVKIGTNLPSPAAVQETAWGLARYAAICQANGLVPIVEPEILMDGDHDLETCQYWTEKVVSACYKALSDQNVMLEGTLLKPNMVLPGVDCAKKYTVEQRARATVTALQRSVPPAVPGIMFLSGGQSEEQATVHLNALNSLDLGPRPWSLSFSYGRALQQSCLRAWKGDPKNVEAAQKAFLERAKANSQAQLGKYTGGAGGQGANASLYQKGYTY